MRLASLTRRLSLWKITCAALLLVLIDRTWCQPQLSNLARGKTVSKGGTNRWGNNRNTVDGNTGATITGSGDSATGCIGCFATRQNRPAWWKVNLGEPHYVSSIRIYSPMSDGMAFRMTSVTTNILLSNGDQDIRPGNTDSYGNYQVLSYIPLEPVTNVQYNQPVDTVRYAQYVAIATGYSSPAVTTGIVLAEVQVLGFTVAEFQPRQFSAQGESFSSIRLSWKSPTDQQIGNIKYEYRCGGSNAWIDFTTSQIDNIERVVPNLASDTTYTCQVRVKDSTANPKSSTATTHCDTPPSPQRIQFGEPTQVSDASRIRWRYTISWGSVSCPHPTNPYKLRLDGLDIQNYPNMTYTFYADGYTAASISVWARNRQGVLSANPRVKSITTAQGLPPQGQPRNFNLYAVSPNCLSYSANSPMYPNSPENQIYYQIRCGNENTWQNTDPKCELSPFTSYTCQIRARNNAHGVSGSVSDSATTFCSGPSLPRDVSFTYLGISSNGGRNRAKYRVSWTAPATSNCNNLRSGNRYEVYHEGSWRWSYDNYLYYDGIYAEGNVQIEVKVRAYNDRNNVSDQATATISTQPIPPQIGPDSYTLVSNSPDCVTMRWTPPTYENGPITVYQYKCTNDANWRDAGGRNDRSETRCGYSPYTSVTCQIRARNSAGPSEDDTNTVRTQCAVPTQLQNIQFADQGTYQDNSRLRRRYRVSWQAPAQHNCLKLRDTNKYSFQDPDNGGHWYNTNNNYYEIYTEGNVDITVRVTATNNQNLVSASQDATFLTAPFRPQKTPTSFVLIPYSPQCIRMSWNPPDHPNGDITSYQYKCTGDDDWVTVTGGGDTRNKDRCGYDAYTPVSCQMEARNVQGNSDTASQGPIRTYCDKPSLPRNIQVNYIGERTNVERQRSLYRVTWQAPLSHNCANLRSVHTYRFSSTQGADKNKGANSRSVDIYADGARIVTVRVEAFNNRNNKSDVATKSITSRAIKPQQEPRNLQVTSGAFNCVSLSWEEPEFPNGVISRYQYKCTDDMNWNNVSASATSVDHCVYPAYTPVTCEIKATNQIGDSNIATGSTRTLCTYPVLPRNISAYIVDEKYFEVSSNKYRRRIKFHLLKNVIDANCQEIPNSGIKFGLIGKGEVDNGRYIDNLDAVRSYGIYVTVINNRNNQTNTTFNYSTGELAPYSPPELSLKFNTTCAFLTIAEPSEPNGVITYYKYGCDYYKKDASPPTDKTVTTEDLGNSTGPTVCEFDSASRLTCQLVAVNSEGESPPALGYGSTNLKVNNPKKPKVGEIKSTDRVPVTLYPIELENNRTTIDSYVVVVRKIVKSNSRRKRNVPQECGMQDQLYNATEAADRNHTCYITAAFASTDIVEVGLNIEVGDASEIGGYYNAPLEENGMYAISIGAKGQLEGGKVFTQFLEETAIFEVTIQPLTTPTQKPITAVVVGTVIPTLAILAAIGVFFFIRWRRNGRKKSPGMDRELDQLSSKSKMVSTASASQSTSDEKEHGKPSIAAKPRKKATRLDIYENVSTSRKVENTDNRVNIETLLEYVMENESQVKDDYQKLQKQSKPVMDAAQLTENKGKCKYKGLYPGDDHRVVLQRSNPNENDFINASHIKGFDGHNEYIASQGPLAATLDDFWLMIWQQGVKAVVMVTNVVENGHMKCVAYWPEDCESTMKFGNITIQMTSCVRWADFVLRELLITKDGKTKMIKQYHFTSWPDHGVPDEMSPFITFYRKVKAETSRLSGPLLVHCSAGVGRTGTFIAMDTILNKAKTGDLNVDLFKCVSVMRERRPSMVQTEIQYLFLHKVIYEGYITEGFVTSFTELDNKLNSEQLYSNTANSVSIEFEHLQKMISIHPLEVSEGQSEANLHKNRDPSILPPSKPTTDDKGKEVGRWLRPKLAGGEDIYINAVFVDAYRKQCHLIATQLPLKHTRQDFWQMICDMNVKVILQLDQAQGGEEFYPAKEGGDTKYGAHSVSCEKIQRDTILSVTSLQVRSKEKAHTISVLAASSWCSGGIPPVEDVLQYLESLERYQQQTGDDKICIMSRDGGFKCGLVVSAYNAVEKMKAEQEVDVYNSALMARYRRPHFIRTLNEYSFLYDMLKQYADQYSDYANFK